MPLPKPVQAHAASCFARGRLGLRWLAPWILAAAAGAAVAQDASVCGSLSNGSNGPFDYRTERDQKLKVVEEFHFTPRVEALLAGQSGAIGQDLDYVLRVFPNHHRALVSMTRLAKRAKAAIAPSTPLSVDCYFERAIRFQPNDTTARMLFATWLNETKRAPEALRQLEPVESLAGDNPFTHYNLGLVYLDLGESDRALKQAHRAAELGNMRLELRQRLETAGKWKEPLLAPVPTPAPEAAASAPG